MVASKPVPSKPPAIGGARSSISRAGAAGAAVLTMLVLSGMGCRGVVPDDPKFRYDTDRVPLDRAVLSYSADAAADEIGAVLEEMIAHDRSIATVERVLTAYGAVCRMEAPQLRCTFGKAWRREIPIPLPIVGEFFAGGRHDAHTDVTLIAKPQHPRRLQLEICVERYNVWKPSEFAQAKATAYRACRVFPSPRSPNLRKG